MEEEVIISSTVRNYLNELVDVLLDKEYFSYIENAEAYVDNLFDQIVNELPYKKHNITPPRLKKHGPYYVKLKGSSRTTWYAFFYKSKNTFVIHYLTNSHTATAAFLNGL